MPDFARRGINGTDRTSFNPGGPMPGMPITETIYRGVIYWGVRAGVALMVIFVILVHMHIVEDTKLFVLMSALILLLSEQGHESAREFQKETESIKGHVGELEGQIDKLKGDVGNLVNSIDNLVDVTTPRLKRLPVRHGSRAEKHPGRREHFN